MPRHGRGKSTCDIFARPLSPLIAVYFALIAAYAAVPMAVQVFARSSRYLWTADERMIALCYTTNCGHIALENDLQDGV